MDPRTGRVLAMVGGFSFAESEFNRATQALRQPGSSFKPIVYSAALDNGYTPASVVLDAPIEIVNGDGSVWRPENYAQEFYGPQTLRVGIEKSRNVMTVRLAKDIGMPLVAEYAKMFGVYDSLNPLLAMALGAGETTDMRMTAAYATIANGGRRIVPTLIDRIQDRYGKTVYRHDAARLRRLRRRRLGGPGRAADHRQPRAGARPDDGLPDHLDDGRRRAARHRHRAHERSTGRWRARPAPRATTRTPGSSASRRSWRSASISASTSPRNMGSQATGGETGGADLHRVHGRRRSRASRRRRSNMPAGMTRDLDRPGDRASRPMPGQAAIEEAFKPGTGPNLITSVIGVNTFRRPADRARSRALGRPVFRRPVLSRTAAPSTTATTTRAASPKPTDAAASCWGAAGCSSGPLDFA